MAQSESVSSTCSLTRHYLSVPRLQIEAAGPPRLLGELTTKRPGHGSWPSDHRSLLWSRAREVVGKTNW